MILRGILRSGKIIVFDEPLAGLDSDSRRKIITLIEKRCRNKTVIIISHNQRLLPYVDRTIKLSDYLHKCLQFYQYILNNYECIYEFYHYSLIHSLQKHNLPCCLSQ